MSKPKLTPWFPGSVKPVRPGVYEVMGLSESCRFYKRWNGKAWFYASQSKSEASATKVTSTSQASTWRGLASQPEVSK